MLKQKTKSILRSCVRELAKWKATRTPVRELIYYAFTFGAGWLACYVTLSSLSPLILAVLGGIVAGALITPMFWLSVAILLHQVDKERRIIDDEHLAAMEARWIDLEKRSRLGALNAMEWKLPDDSS